MKHEKSKNQNITIVLAIAFVLVIVAQVLNFLVTSNIHDESIVLIDHFLKISYVENTGGAFGIGCNGTVGFVIISLAVIALILRFLILKKDMIDLKTGIALGFILAGGISNLIERIAKGFVVDYIDISDFLKFPVFNFADMLIVIGWVALVIFVAFYWRKELYE